MKLILLGEFMFHWLVSLRPPNFDKYPLLKKISWPNTDCVYIWIEETQEWQILADKFNGGDVWESEDDEI